jgi:CheY-like chemotaxis protein
MTGNAMSEDRAACLAAGMEGYLSKPIRPAELLAELEATPSLASAALTTIVAGQPGAADG